MDKKGQAVSLGNAPRLVLVIGLMVMIGAALALALNSFRTSQCQFSYSDTAGCLNSTGGTGGNLGWSYASNISNQGLVGVDNLSDQIPTIGTIVGVALIIGVVVGAFAFFGGRQGL